MHTLTFLNNNQTFEYADKVDELTPKQWVTFVDLLLKVESGAIDNYTYKLKLVCSLLNLKYRKISHLPKTAQENIYINLYRICETIDSFFNDDMKDGKKIKVPKLETTRNLLPILPKLKWHGPQDTIMDLTFNEYIDANEYCREYRETNDENALNKLVAVLYQDKRFLLWLKKKLPKYDGRTRVKYNKNHIDGRAKKVAKLPFHIRYAVYLFYRSCELFLQEGELSISGNVIKLSVLYERDDDTPDTGPSIGMTGLLFEMAQAGVFGSIDETANRNLFDILARLYQLKMMNKAMKEYYKNQTPAK